MAEADHASRSIDRLRPGPLVPPSPAASQAGFLLFVLLNAILFIRPSDIVPGLQTWRLYEVCALLCFACAVRPVIAQLSPSSLLAHPITACVVGLLGAAILSHLGQLHLGPAIASGASIAKLVLYYLLLVGVVDTVRRLRWFLGFLTLFACAQIGMAVLQHHGAIDLPALRPIEEQAAAIAHGEVVTQYRLCGTGIFHDSNYLGLLASTTIALCLYHLHGSVRRRGRGRILQLLLSLSALCLCAHALMLTQSRGAFLALLAAAAALSLAVFGWTGGILAAAVLMFLLMRLFAGRQTSLSPRRTTAQMRLGYWAHGLSLFAQSPALGIGQGEFLRSAGRVVHNSFLESFTEMGFVGGTFILGAFYLAISSLLGIRADGAVAADAGDTGELLQLRPFLLALVVAWAAGMLTLSRAYVPPTYLILGLAATYLNLLTPEHSPHPRIDGRLALRLTGVSVAFLLGVHLVVRRFRKV